MFASLQAVAFALPFRADYMMSLKPRLCLPMGSFVADSVSTQTVGPGVLRLLLKSLAHLHFWAEVEVGPVFEVDMRSQS